MMETLISQYFLKTTIIFYIYLYLFLKNLYRKSVPHKLKKNTNLFTLAACSTLCVPERFQNQHPVMSQRGPVTSPMLAATIQPSHLVLPPPSNKQSVKVNKIQNGHKVEPERLAKPRDNKSTENQDFELKG